MKQLLPEDELERLEALRRYRILDTPRDRAFDHIVELAAALFRAPIAMVSLVDHDRIWFKSHHGIEAQQIAREDGLCASVIRAPAVYHIRDATHDTRAQANPLVAGPFGVRFYAACAPPTVSIWARSVSSTAYPANWPRPKHRCSVRSSAQGGAAEFLGMKPTTLASRITALRLNRKTRA